MLPRQWIFSRALSRTIVKEARTQFHPRSDILVLESPPPVYRLFIRGSSYHKRQRMASNEGSAAPAAKELSPPPDFLEHRENLWQEIKLRYEAEVAAQPREKVLVKVHGKEEVKELEATMWQSSPFSLARSAGPKAWVDTLVISKLNGVLWDLERPIEKGNCEIEYLTFDEFDGQQVFWHSSAHILGEALERLYGGHLCYGPPIEGGYYYDMFMCDDRGCGCGSAEEVSKSGDAPAGISNALNQLQIDGKPAPLKSKGFVPLSHHPAIEDLMKKIVKQNQPFERLVLTKGELLKMFEYNPFKHRIIQEKIKDDRTTVYKCGTLIDLCRGPHVRHTGLVKALKVTKASCSYWEGKAEAEILNRVYGISFPDQKPLKEWIKFQEEAAKRDHRKIGTEQQLFTFHPLSPGSCFFYPRGAHIYNTLMNFIRSEYRKRGFEEVISPNIYNSKLWEKSGHWQHYSEDMFAIDIEKEKFALKPMNCPGHCLLFDSVSHSWRELPIRYADFGVLHRNEASGALTGLTRVRRFQQDDAHIFCRKDQIEQEMTGALRFLKDVYSVFGFTFDLKLSTRPEKFLGDAKDWDEAEQDLKNSLDGFCKEVGQKWTLNPGDGAFYGPKIDITVSDALRRHHQCATIQLDFQLPQRFNLSYVNTSGEKERPVIIHRAIFGSLERFIAILTENYGGKWPFWLSPIQACIATVSDSQEAYALEVQRRIKEAGFRVDVELDPGQTLPKKVRNAQLAKYNFILVIGAKEVENGTVNVRTRDNKMHGEIGVDALIGKFRLFSETRDPEAETHFGGKQEEAPTNGPAVAE